MGGCFSSVSTSASNPWPTAKVVTVNGSLSEYAVPMTVSQVLEAEEGTASSSSSFICNSDRLYYDDYIPALDSEDELEANQIYFVLARSKLERRLTATDMAALAVRATLALQNQTASASTSNSNLRPKFEKKKNPHRHRRNSNNKARISPVLINFENSGSDGDDVIHLNGYTIGPYKGQQREKASASLGLSRSGSVKKLQRYTSKRAKMAVRSFRLRLSTIHEGSVL